MKRTLIIFLLIGLAYCYPDGAPCATLYSLLPNEQSHKAPPQTGNFPYRFQIFEKGDEFETPTVQYRPCTRYVIRLHDRKGGIGFRGFMIQPRLLQQDGSIDQVHRLEGFQHSEEWKDKGIKSLKCSAHDTFDTITHANRDKKKMVEVEWMPLRNEGPLQFL